ncbi:MAG: bifunctional folylpolyglutamate synthase/dihydrofolate synthase [Bacteroidales bacterium]|nr:bifunctional folylpolyglutamate synthase/dihydrofolate synthase [Bacteroidales bacterium]
MDYNQAIDFLYNSLPFYQRIGIAAYKADLENAYLMDAHFNKPHRNYKAIHIAGTNGKGSVSHILASVLQASGYKTGLYTSPHLLDFRERIKVNGIPVSKKFVTQFTNQNMNFFKRIKPSFFEMTVFMAFEYFAHENVDIAVIETGLGGRLDTTNIISPELSVITNIGMDHMQLLGDTTEKIAAEKAGIIKANTPVIIGDASSEIKKIFEKTAFQKGSSIYYADQIFKIVNSLQNTDGTISHYFPDDMNPGFHKLITDLRGMYQKKNIVTAIGALRILKSQGLKITHDSIRNGIGSVIKTTGLMGRWQVISFNPLIVCDIAHNADGLKETLAQIQNTAHKDLHLVLGFVNDKNLDEIFSLFPANASYYFCKPDIPRAARLEDIEKAAMKFNLNYTTFEKVNPAFIKAQSEAVKEDLIYIGGSTFVVADFLRFKIK